MMPLLKLLTSNMCVIMDIVYIQISVKEREISQCIIVGEGDFTHTRKEGRLGNTYTVWCAFLRLCKLAL